MRGAMRVAIAALSSVIFASAAQAEWTIVVHSNVPQASIWERGRPQHEYWSYWMAIVSDRKCWSVTGGKYYRADKGNGIVYGGNYVNQLGPVEIYTETRSAEPGCMAADKKMTLSIGYRNSQNHHVIPEHVYHFTVTGGGVFSDYSYKLNGTTYAKKYWDSADLCTKITVYGKDKPDDVETKSGNCH